MNIEEIFNSCIDGNLNRKSLELLEALSKLESVKEFTDDFATDEELDKMIEDMMADRDLIPRVGRLMVALSHLRNEKNLSSVEDFI